MNSKNRQYSVTSILLFILLFPLVWINVKDNFRWGDDYAQYLLQAKCIAEGKEQQVIITPGIEQYSPPLRSIGFPVILSVVYSKYGLAFEKYFQLISLLLIMTGLVLHLLFSQSAGSVASATAILFVFYLPALLLLKSELLPEIPLLLFCYTTLLFYDKNKTLYTVIFLSCALLTKPEAICLASALFVNEIIKNRNIKETVSILKPVLIYLLVPFGIFYWVNNIYGISIENILWLGNRINISDLVETIPAGIENYHRIIINIFTFEAPAWVNGLAGWSLLLFFIAGICRRIKQFNQLDLFFLFYTVLIIIYPYSKADFKFLLLIFPIAALYTSEGIYFILELIPAKALRKKHERHFANAPAIYFIGMLIAASASIKIVLAAKEETGENNFKAAAQFIQQNVKENEAILFAKPWVLRLYTGKHSLPVNYADRDTDLRNFIFLHHPTFALVCFDKTSQVYSSALSKYISEQTDSEIIYSDSIFVLYRLSGI